MYIAYKLIINNYKIKYCADSIVYHSHKFTLKEIYNRYKLTGKFFKENSYLDKYGTTNSGAKLAKYVLKRIIQEHRLVLLFRYPFEMAARLLGMKAGKLSGQ
jgi:rhamnosyltransferase